jgi:5-methyltetrahydrofolate--homocysteine methyltransferase
MDFTELIESKKIIILDGATGTQLVQRGAPAGGAANLVAPDTVVAVHSAYIDAGSNAVIANTFCMNRIYMKHNKIDAGLEEINRAGVELARRAAGDRALVFGDIGPTGELLKPVGNITPEELYDVFLEQARALADAGVDAFIIETMMDMNEAACAVRACRENFAIPVIASMTFATDRDGGRTTMGHRAADCAATLEAAGAQSLASNCGDLAPSQVATIVRSYRSVSKLPILVEPNAGMPRLDDNDKAVYDMSPEDFAHGVAACIEAGAAMVGGCCGTTPEHIRALADLCKSL